MPRDLLRAVAIADTAIAVGAINANHPFRQPEFFTSFGPRLDGFPKPDIAAPGSGVTSCVDGPVDGPRFYSPRSGTSMSPPVAAGAAALVLEENPSLSPAQVRTILRLSAKRAQDPDNELGSGILNCLHATQLAARGVPEGREALPAPFEDCDEDRVPDRCQIAFEPESDSNGDGRADTCAVLFHRGDSTGDGDVDVSDGIRIFGFLFLGEDAPSRLEAADTNDDGGLDVSGGIFILNFLFTGGDAPPSPGPTGEPCGNTFGSPTYLSCDAYGAC